MNVNIGPFAFPLAQILVFACAVVAVAVGWMVGRKRQIGISDVIFDMALVAVPTGRAVFVAIWFSAYQANPWSVFDIRDGGFEPWTALIAAILMAVWRMWQRPALLKPLFVGLTAGIGAWIVLQAAGWAGTSPPRSAPAVSLMNLDGKPSQLSASAAGRAMVVNM